MRTAFVKLLVSITISAMVALAVMGTYIIAMKSQDNPIVAPVVNPTIQRLPNQAPPAKQRPVRGPFLRPGGINPDAPAPK